MTDRSLYTRGSELRITVLAPTVVDVLQGAGGWIFDRARMGWTVSVGVAEPSDDRPLRILGVHLLDFDFLLRTVHDEAIPSALAVAATLHAHEGQVRDAVCESRGTQRFACDHVG